MKRLLADIAFRLFVVAYVALYPVFAVLALPWALINSAGSWGHTTYRSWLEGWQGYSLSSLKSAGRELIKPLRWS